MAEKPNWETLNEVQLKGSLVRRGLSADGTKEELILRLKQYESDESPILMRSRMLYGYYVTKALRTVLITPFKKEIMSNSDFAACLEEATTYQIQKAKSGNSAVRLVFKTVDEGDAVYFQLKNQLSRLDVDVLHPANPSTRSERTDEIIKIFRVSEQYGDRLLKRTVILEKLSAGINKEDKLVELFPEAVDVVSFQVDQPNNGFAILEFTSEQEVDDFIKRSGNEMELEGETVTLNKFQVRHKEFFKSASKKKAAEEEITGMGDEERVALSEEIGALDKELVDLVDNKDLTGKEKVQKVCQLNELRKDKQRVLNIDTKRRLAAKETEMPEGKERMLKSTEQILDRAKETAESKENDTSKSSPKKKPNGETSKGTKEKPKTPKSTTKSAGKGGNSSSPKKKTTKVVSMKGVRPSTTQGRGQNRTQMSNYQRGIQSAGPGGKYRPDARDYGPVPPLMGNYPRGVQPGRQGLSPDKRQALVRGRGMNRNMQPSMPGVMNQFGCHGRPGQQNYQKPMMGRQYEDAGDQASAKMIVEGLTNVLTEKVRELEQIHHQNLQNQGQQFGHPGNYDERMQRNYDGRMPMDQQDRYTLEQFYRGGYDSQGMMGYDQHPSNMRDPYEERAPYTNFRGRGMGRGFPRGNPYDPGSGFGRGPNW